jgi:hypothetical protein
MAIREIYCNSLDEPKNVVCTVGDIPSAGAHDRTRIYIDINDEVQGIIDNWANYFCFERSQDIVFEIPNILTVFRKPWRKESIIYRRGIRVAVSKEPGCFDYDFNKITINELREADFDDVLYHLKENLTSKFNKELIETILKSTDTWEKTIHFNSWDSIRNKAAWTGAIGGSTILPSEYNEKFMTQTPKDEAVEFLQVPTLMAQIISVSMPEVTVLGFSGNSQTLALPEIMDDEQSQRVTDCLRLLELSGICTEGEFIIQASTFTTSYIKASHKDNMIIVAFDIIDDADRLTHALFREILLIRHEATKQPSFEKYILDKLLDAIVYTD